MIRKIREFFSIQRAKNARGLILLVLLIGNIFFFLLSAFIISRFSLSGTEKMNFIEAAFCTVTMILDAGCIQFVIADIGHANVILSIICLMIILIGTVIFTGGVIGYMTNVITSYIDNSNTGKKKLIIEEHTVILNWNARASEIINDLLYSPVREKIVVLVQSRKAEIEKEIAERIADTVSRENDGKPGMGKKDKTAKPAGSAADKNKPKRKKFRNRITVIVREGDVYSSKQLADISLEKAKTIIILGSDINETACKYESKSILEERSLGNSQTVKTLMQVADITASMSSRDNQQIIVEITDPWTDNLVRKIISLKKNDKNKHKCNIVPVNINKAHGQILSQFSLMPELNLVYKTLFSNKGSAFYAIETDKTDSEKFVSEYLAEHTCGIPLTLMESGEKMYEYYAASSEKNIFKRGSANQSGFSVKLRNEYTIEHKNVVILGHNSKCKDIMQGFQAFYDEWNTDDMDILNIIVIDDKANLDKMDYYRQYPFVTKIVEASIYERELICSTVERFVDENTEDTSVLILSDDSVMNENIDSNALANLVYVQDIINRKVENNPDFDVESIDVIVEIIDPKHHYIVKNYSVNNVVISNRYISKMITQIGQKEPLYDFYRDILTYDESGAEVFKSKEIYTKKVSRLFEEIPGKCTSAELIRAVYEASSDSSLPAEQRNPAIVLGYIKPMPKGASDSDSYSDAKMVLFEGDQNEITVELTDKDKLIVYSTH